MSTANLSATESSSNNIATIIPLRNNQGKRNNRREELTVRVWRHFINPLEILKNIIKKIDVLRNIFSIAGIKRL